MFIIQNKVSIILHSQMIWSSSLVPGIRGPGWFISYVIQNKISVILNLKLERSLTDISGVRSPDSIVRSEITSLVENKVSVLLNSCIVFLGRTLYKFINKKHSLLSRMQFISISRTISHFFYIKDFFL